jgi:hypothetical protein
MKGYNKLTDVRFALSDNEILIEVRDPKKENRNTVHRISKTLFNEINVDESSVELLVDFISVKLKKRDKA